MPTLSLDDAELHYEQHGGGPPVVDRVHLVGHSYGGVGNPFNEELQAFLADAQRSR